jgi:hypothetical protein
MYETQLNFTCVYCLVDVLSFYETPSAPQWYHSIPKCPDLPVLACGLAKVLDL